MAVNKNFVVKNGLEVATNAVLVDATSKNVGIGSTLPANTLDVRGGIGATDIIVTGVSSFRGDVQVGASGSIFYVDDSTDNVGVGTSLPAYTLDVRGPVSSGTTALYVYGDAHVTGDLIIDDFVLQDLYLTGISTFVGFSTFQDFVFVKNGFNVGGGATFGTLEVSGVSTFAGNVDINSFADISGNVRIGGISTIANYALIESGLNVTGVGATTTTLNVTGVSTFGGNVDVNSFADISGNLNVGGITTSTDKEIYNQFDITNDGSSAYQFAATGIGFTEATNNPTLYLTRGKNYRFSVNASGHPFYIKTVNSTGVGNSYNDGVTNNGAAVGIITFKVPYNAPDILHYNCSIHSGMHGEIRVGGAGAGVGVGSEGTFIGAGATMIDFKSTSGTNINSVDIESGIATVTVQPGVSIGLAIALGG